MKNDGLDSNLKNKLDNLKQVPERNLHSIAHGKADFLRQAISYKAKQRQRGWINNLFPFTSIKERLPMLKPIMAVILLITILFGGTAGTVYAAQGSLPDQPLYKVKTWSEDLLLAVTRSPQTQLEQNLNFTDRRIMEIASMQAAGTPIPQQVQTRLQAQLNQVLNLAAGMDDQHMIMELERIRLRTEVQLQMMSMIMAGDSSSPDPVLAMVRTSLQQQLQMASQGKNDEQGFQKQIQNQIQNNDLIPFHGNEDVQDFSVENQDQFQNNNQVPIQDPGFGQGGTPTPMISDQNGSGSVIDKGEGSAGSGANDPDSRQMQQNPNPGNGNKP